MGRLDTRPKWSRRLLALAGDQRLVDQVLRGNEAAFEVVFERYGAAILGFCRHMLGSPEEAEDAVQHTFAAAYRDLERGGEREIALKPWLFAIARNRCFSILRARREQPVGEPGALAVAVPSRVETALVTTGLSEQVEQRAELRQLLADLGELPEEQRAALLLAELGDLSHAEVAGVLGCEVARVKALVFRARSGLIARREARDTPCEIVREQLANLRGGSLRRTELRLHLRDCPGCRAYRAEVKQQRQMLAAALPVAPSLGLKSSVLAAVGLGGGGAGGLTAAGGGAALGGVFGGATLAKVAVVGVLAGGVVAGQAVVDPGKPARPGHPAATPGSSASDGEGGGVDAAAPVTSRDGRAGDGVAGAPGVGRSDGKTGPTRSGSEKASHEKGQQGARRGRHRGLEQGQRRGHERNAAGGGNARGQGRGRGPIEAPPAQKPVKRGPPPKPEPRSPTTQQQSGTAPQAPVAPKKDATTQAAPAPPPPLPAELEVPEAPNLNGKGNAGN